MSSSAVSSGSKASLEGSIEGLSDLLECSVCLEPLGLAHKVLPCQHTFCTSCLEDLEAKQKKKNGDPPGSPLFICPECRAEVRTPISALPSNVILNRILSGIHSNTPTSSPKNSPLDSLKLKTEHSVELKSHVQKKTSVNPLPLAIGDHRKLPLPIHSAPIRFDNNNIPGKLSIIDRILKYCNSFVSSLKLFTILLSCQRYLFNILLVIFDLVKRRYEIILSKRRLWNCKLIDIVIFSAYLIKMSKVYCLELFVA